MIRSSSKSHPVAGFGMRDTNPPGHGARISRIVKKSPAEKAELRINDVIIKIDNRPTANIYDVQSVILSFYNAGDTAEFTFVRD